VIGNGGVKLIVFQAVYDHQPVVLRELQSFLEHPPFSGSLTIHANNGKISHIEKKETVKD